MYCGSTVAPQVLLEEIDSLQVEMVDTLVEMADRQEEITTLRQAMEKMAIQSAAMMNHGKKIIRATQETKAEPLLQCG